MTVFTNIFSIQFRLRQFIKYCNSSISGHYPSKTLCLLCRTYIATGVSVTAFVVIAVLIIACVFCACCPLYKYRNRGAVYNSGKYTYYIPLLYSSFKR